MAELIYGYGKSRYFYASKPETGTVPTSGTELVGVITASGGTVTKSYGEVRPLNSDGFADRFSTIADVENLTLSCVRPKSDGIYTGADSTGTYAKLREWVDTVGVNTVDSDKCVIECIPRGNNTYEGSMWICTPESVKDHDRELEGFQGYDCSFICIGPKVPIEVTYTKSTDSFAFAEVD